MLAMSRPFGRSGAGMMGAKGGIKAPGLTFRRRMPAQPPADDVARIFRSRGRGCRRYATENCFVLHAVMRLRPQKTASVARSPASYQNKASRFRAHYASFARGLENADLIG